MVLFTDYIYSTQAPLHVYKNMFWMLATVIYYKTYIDYTAYWARMVTTQNLYAIVKSCERDWLVLVSN